MRREKRLASILLLLKAKKSQTADELATTLEVDVRTIYRDIDSLVEAGLPIRGARGPTGGYSLAEYYPVDPLVYSSDDALSLVLGASGQLETGSRTPGFGQHIDLAVKLIAEALPDAEKSLVHKIRERFLFDTRNWFWRDPPLTQFPELKEAILNDSSVEILYTERGGPELKSDVFDSYGLVWRQGHWYLLAFSHARHAFERHRLQRILGVRVTGEKFHRAPTFDLSACWKGVLDRSGRGGILVRLKIDYPATLDFEFFAWKKGHEIIKREDYWIVPMYVDRLEWLVPLALSYGDKLEVLEPKELRDKVLERLKLTIHKYEEPEDRTK